MMYPKQKAPKSDVYVQDTAAYLLDDQALDRTDAISLWIIGRVPSTRSLSITDLAEDNWESSLVPKERGILNDTGGHHRFAKPPIPPLVTLDLPD